MGRMGRAFYVRASGAAVMSMPQSHKLPIVEAIPIYRNTFSRVNLLQPT